MLKKLFSTLLLVFALFMLSPSLDLGPELSFAQGNLPGESVDGANFMFDLSSVTHDSIEGGPRQSWIRRGVEYFAERIISLMASVIGTIAVLILVFGGFLMISSAGNEQRYDQGKNYAKFAIIGLIVTLSAYILVTLVQLLINSIYA